MEIVDLAGEEDSSSNSLRTYMAGRQVTYLELSAHRKPGDLWFAIKGRVYDVSRYLDHPGGVNLFEEVAGKDATAAFEDANHSRLAKDGLDLYLVGTLGEGSKPAMALKWPLVLILLISLAVWIILGR